MKGKKDIKEQVEALQSQAKYVMNDTAVPVDERIQEAADIYRQAEKLAEKVVWTTTSVSRFCQILPDSFMITACIRKRCQDIPI